MIQYVKNIILYGCDSEADYQLVSQERKNFNYNTWRRLSLMIALFFAVEFLTSFSVDSVHLNCVAYLVMMLTSCAAYAFLRFWTKPDDQWALWIPFIMTAMLLGFGILIGCVISPHYPAVTFHVVMLSMSMVTVCRPWQLMLLDLVMAAAYVITCLFTKTGEVLSLDVYDLCSFLMLACYADCYIIHIRMKQFLITRRAERASVTDALTGLGNRQAYENDTVELNRRENLVFVLMDVNGLKRINDERGHLAGDELLQGAAQCIRESFGAYGRTYRVGGDEFWALLDGDQVPLEEILADFRRRVADWHGKLAPDLSISIGCACRSEFPGQTADQLGTQADLRMYSDKAAYYQKMHIDRRKR